jgi:hypothetical protein
VDGYKRAEATETLTTFEKKNHVHEFFIETPWNPDGGMATLVFFIIIF